MAVTIGVKREAEWLSRYKEPKKDGLDYKKILILGKPGTGKTTFSATAPNPLFLDFDKGMRTIPDKELREKWRIPFQRGDHIDLFMKDIFQQALNREGEFAPGGLFESRETLVVDSLHKMASFIAHDILITLRKDVEKDKLGYEGYDILKRQMEKLVEIAKDIPMHVIFTTGVKTIEDENEHIVEVQPMIEGSYRNIIAHEFGEVYYFERKAMIGKKEAEYLGYSNVYKNLAILKSTNKSPEVPYSFPITSFEALYGSHVQTESK